MKILLTAVCIIFLCIVFWQGITQEIPRPATTYTMMVWLGGPIIAVIEGFRGKARRTASERTRTLSKTGSELVFSYHVATAQSDEAGFTGPVPREKVQTF